MINSQGKVKEEKWFLGDGDSLGGGYGGGDNYEAGFHDNRGFGHGPVFCDGEGDSSCKGLGSGFISGICDDKGKIGIGGGYCILFKFNYGDCDKNGNDGKG